MVTLLKDFCASRVTINIANDFEMKNLLHSCRDLFNQIGCDVPHKICDPDYTCTKYHSIIRNYEMLEVSINCVLKKFVIPQWMRKQISVVFIILHLKQTLDWAQFHNEKFGLPVEYCCDFIHSSVFTSRGMINKEMVARELLKDTGISSETRYSIACYYCFSDVIPVLWEQLENKKLWIDKRVFKNSLGARRDIVMVTLWSHFLLKLPNMLEENCSFSLCKFKVAARNGNGVSAQNCWEELNEVEKKKGVEFFGGILKEFCKKTINTRNTFPIFLYEPFKQYIDVVKFLVPLLNKNQLKLLFHHEQWLYVVLYYFLSLSYQHLFINMVEHTWEILKEFEFYLLLNKIASLMRSSASCKLCNYHDIFINLWKKFPTSFKRFFFKIDSQTDYRKNFEKGSILYSQEFANSEYFCVIRKLFSPPLSDMDMDVIEIILGDATTEEKLLIVVTHIQFFWSKTVETADLELFVLFIDRCLPEEMIDVKRNFVKRAEVCSELWQFILQGKLRQVRNFIKWAGIGNEIDIIEEELLLKVDKTLLRDCDIDKIKYIDEALKWILSSDNIEDYKKLLILRADDIITNEFFILSFAKANFETVDFYLEWILLSENQIKEYKKAIADFTLDNCKDGRVKRQDPYKWTKLLNMGSFVFRLTFDYSDFLFCKKYCIDAFMSWCELSKGERKSFKKSLINQKYILALCSHLLISNRKDPVRKLIEWSKVSEAEVRNFYSSLIEELHLREYFVIQNVELNKIEKFFECLPLSEEEIKSCKKVLSYRNSEAVIQRCLDESRLEVEAVLNLFFSSKEEILLYMKKFNLNLKRCKDVPKSCILAGKFSDADALLTWVGMDETSKVNFVETTFGENKKTFYQMIIGLLLKNDGNKILSIFSSLRKYEIPLNDLKEDFLTWCYETVNEDSCWFCLSRSRNCFCRNEILTVKTIEKFGNIFNKHISNLEGSQIKKKSKRNPKALK